jgi:hypothetical protein
MAANQEPIAFRKTLLSLSPFVSDFFVHRQLSVAYTVVMYGPEMPSMINVNDHYREKVSKTKWFHIKECFSISTLLLLHFTLRVRIVITAMMGQYAPLKRRSASM